MVSPLYYITQEKKSKWDLVKYSSTVWRENNKKKLSGSNVILKINIILLRWIITFKGLWIQKI